MKTTTINLLGFPLKMETDSQLYKYMCANKNKSIDSFPLKMQEQLSLHIMIQHLEEMPAYGPVQ